MDSLLANYASSSDDEEHEQSPEAANTQPSSKLTSSSSSGASIFSSLPPPRSSFSSLLPSPKSHLPHSDLSKPDSELQQFEVSDKPRSSSSIFSLPPPKSSIFSLLPPPKSYLRDPILSSSKPTYQEEQQFEVPDEPKSPSSNFSLPPPKSSIFSLLPPPKSHLPGPIISSSTRPTHQEDHQFEVADKPKSSSSIFSRLPPPKSQNADPFSLKSLPSAQPNPRKVVQLKLPVNPSMLKSRDSDDEEDDDEKEREGRKPAVEMASVSSFLSSIPAPRNSSTLGALPSAAGSVRRSILEADVPTIRSNDSKDSKIGVKMSAESNLGTYNGYENHNESISAPLGQAGSSIESTYGVEGDASGWVSSNTNYENSNTNYENYEGYTGYENYSYYEQQDGNWGGGSTATAQSPMVQMDDSSLKIPRKRGRHDIPQEIIEVKQDELMKDRPREDQVKLTGIAFGPSYQPVSTSKGKPSKLHKRKHQIGTLYFDMRQKEMELAERRSKGLLTKAETHAKYGW